MTREVESWEPEIVFYLITELPLLGIELTPVYFPAQVIPKFAPFWTGGASELV